MAANSAAIHALNVYGNSLERLSLEQQECFNDLIFRLGAQDLRHEVPVPPTRFAHGFGQAPTTLNVTDKYPKFTQFGDAAQYGSAPHAPHNFTQFGSVAQQGSAPHTQSSVSANKARAKFFTRNGPNKIRRNAGRSSRFVPQITLPSVVPSQTLWMDGPKTDPNELAIDDEEDSSNDQDDNQQK